MNSGINGVEILFEGEQPLPEKFISIGNTNVYKTLSGETLNNYDYGNGGYILKVDGKHIFINSDDELGKINGVYSFCEENLGYQYYAYDEEKFENIENVAVNFSNNVTKPSFDGRNVHSYYTLNNVGGKSMYDNIVRLKANDVVSTWDEKYGDANQWCSSLSDMSNVFDILYLKEYYNDHPDWFMLEDEYKNLNFKTMTDDECYTIIQKHSQICYTKGYYDNSKGGMFDTYCSNLIKHIEKEKDAKLFLLGMADNNLQCNCAKCREERKKYKESGLSIRFVNKVAERVNEYLKNQSKTPSRKVTLVTFAYYKTMEPPVDSNFKPIDSSVVASDNVCVLFAPLTNCSYYYPLNDEVNNKFMADNLKGWQNIASSFAVWDYRAYYNQLLVPFSWWNTAKENAVLYKNMNTVSVFHQAYAYTPTTFGKMDDYVRAKLLFDVNQDVKTLMNDFIENYYKECAPFIKEYINYIDVHDKLVKDRGFKFGLYHNQMQKAFWTFDELNKVKEIFDRAYQTIESLPQEKATILKNRIDVESRFYRFALLELYGDKFTKSEYRNLIDGFKNANGSYEKAEMWAVNQKISDKLANYEKIYNNK